MIPRTALAVRYPGCLKSVKEGLTMQPSQPLAQRIGALRRAMGPFIQVMTQSSFAQRCSDPLACDFVAGNPRELTLTAFVPALTRWSVPLNKDWFTYKMMDPTAQAATAAAPTERTRAVVINTPHNPTGKIFPPRTLEALAAVLRNASSRHGRPIYRVRRVLPPDSL